MFEFKRKDNENEEQFIWRIGQAKDKGEIHTDWNEIAGVINKEFRPDESQYYESSAYRKPYQYARKFFEAGVFENLNQEKYLKDIQEAKIELEKERKKIQTEKLELNKRLREEARDEMIADKIVSALKECEPLPTPQYNPPLYPCSKDKEYLLVFGDCHYGIEFRINDLLGNVLNEYSPHIFYDRMDTLLKDVIEVIEKEKINKLNIFEMGDGIQGIIRLNSQLLKLRYGIIESTVRYAEYISKWLNELSKYTDINFQMVEDSNHNQLRICGTAKNAFSEENMSKVMITIIKMRLQDNKRVNIIENPTGLNFCKLSHYNILGIHGEVNNLATSINEFSRSYNIRIDYLVGGHKHHKESKEVGQNCESLSVGSVIGIDPYGLSLNKISNASASLFVFEEGKGKTMEYTFKLN